MPHIHGPIKVSLRKKFLEFWSDLLNCLALSYFAKPFIAILPLTFVAQLVWHQDTGWPVLLWKECCSRSLMTKLCFRSGKQVLSWDNVLLFETFELGVNSFFWTFEIGFMKKIICQINACISSDYECVNSFEQWNDFWNRSWSCNLVLSSYSPMHLFSYQAKKVRWTGCASNQHASIP